MFYFDPMYFLFVAPAMILALWAQFKVKSAYAEASHYVPESGVSGREAASKLLEADGIYDVGIEMAQGFLGDHYDPRKKVLRLSEDVYNGRSLAAVGIAAHEAGHAIQDKVGYFPLTLRNGIVPLASVGGNLSWIFLALGLFLGSIQFILFGIGLFSLIVFFQIINLPVEFNASARAKELLISRGLVSPNEVGIINKVLSAAAMTYVAATFSAILTLVYYLFRFGLIGNDRRD